MPLYYYESNNIISKIQVTDFHNIKIFSRYEIYELLFTDSEDVCTTHRVNKKNKERKLWYDDFSSSE